MRHDEPTFKAVGRRWLGVLPLVLVTACSAPEIQPAANSVAAGPTSAASPPSSSASPSSTPSSPASAPGSAVAVEPDWVGGDPQLTRVVSGATPVCALKDTFDRDKSGAVTHGFEVYAPTMPQADLEARFREGAKALGYEVTPQPLVGPGFMDEAKQRFGSIGEGRVSIHLAGVASAVETARALAIRSGFETWSLVEAVGGAWKRLSIQRGSGAAATLEVALPVPPARRAALDAWTSEHAIAKDGASWVRKHQDGSPGVAGIVIDVDKDGTVSILETRGRELVGPACASPSSRDAPSSSPAAAPSTKRAQPSSKSSKSSKKEEEDQLFRDMMGE